MKECYFRPENIDKKSMLMTERIAAMNRKREQVFHPENSALLVIDMQNYFTDPGSHAYVPSSAAVIPRIKKLAEAFAAKKRPVISTLHINTPADAGMMGEWWGELLAETDTRSELNKDLDLPFSVRIRKSQYDAFYTTELDLILQQNNVTDLVITGVMTHLCCETTARSAFVHGYRVFFPADGTATY
ncbi:isochorismatase family protein, partial [Methanolacinia paynteri]|uniref:isochorismatase family protein n=1 Tax=Methanolacinia paynteri TaxID=230356 RepID=UPI000693B9FC